MMIMIMIIIIIIIIIQDTKHSYTNKQYKVNKQAWIRSNTDDNCDDENDNGDDDDDYDSWYNTRAGLTLSNDMSGS